MRVALFVPWFGSPSATFVVAHVADLLDRGHEVTIFTRGIDEAWPAHADIERFGMLERVVQMPERLTRGYGRYRSTIGSVRRIWRRKPSAVLRALLPRRGERNSLQRLFDADAGNGFGQFDAILAHFSDGGRLAAEMRQVGLLAGPLATIFHGADVNLFLCDKAAPGRRALVETGELFLPVSNYFAGVLLGAGVPAGRIRVHRMGVRPSSFRYKPRILRQGQTPRLIAVCRLVEKKGLAYAIEAVADLVRRGVDVQFRIVGDGPLRSVLQGQVEELGMAEHIHLDGWMPHDAVERALGEAHVFVAPSVTADDGNTEGVPVSIMEAMAVGLPVVATQHAGIPELVADPLTGRCVPERDAQALAQALHEVLDNPEDWPTLGRQGRQVVERSFNAEKLAIELQVLLEEIAGVGPGPATDAEAFVPEAKAAALG